MSIPETPPCTDGNCPEDPSRRRFLQHAAAGAAGLLLASALPGCKPDEPEIKVGNRDLMNREGSVTVDFNDDRVFVRDLAGDVVALSLTCSHKRCTVRWKVEEEEFHCPCHKGKYDRDGQRLSGPPPSDLRRFKTEWRGDDLYVLNQDA